MTTWQQYAFFERQQVRDGDDGSLTAPAALANCSPGATIVASDRYAFVGEPSGAISALDSEFREVSRIEAYRHGSLEQLHACAGDMVLTVGEDADGQRSLKLWSIAKGKFSLLSTTQIYHEQPFPVTSVAALPDLTHVALGFADGRVTLVKGDLVRDRGAKARTVYEAAEPITGLEFMSDYRSTTLFIFTTGKTLTLTVLATGAKTGQAPKMLESVGAALSCTSHEAARNEVVVARNDGLYVWRNVQRATAHALPGVKTRLVSHRGYQVVVQPPSEGRKAVTSTRSDDFAQSSRLTILDLENRLIAHGDYFPNGLRTVFCMTGRIFLYTLDSRFYRLDEISLASKIDMLFAKQMYVLALKLAKDNGYAEEKVADIHVRYGDHLYSRKEFDTSVDQYIAAVRHCNLSSVMRRFLSAQHVPALTRFLEALHTTDRATPEYSTLLLNCYAKLKQRDKLKRFIRSDRERALDLDVAVALCRQAGFYDEAISLATRHRDHAMCLGLIIEDKRDMQAALSYLRRLKSPAHLGILLSQYGSQLMRALPSETTRLLVDFYTGAFQTEQDAHVHATGIMSPPTVQRSTSNAGFYDSLMSHAQALPSLQSLDLSALNPMRRTSTAASDDFRSPAPSVAERPLSTIYTPPPPQTAFTMLMDHPAQFIHFLEVILERQVGTSEDDRSREVVVSTLLELYLKQARSDEEKREKYEEQARRLMSDESNHLDASNAMLLFHLTDFHEGAVALQERAGSIEDVFRSYCTAKDTAGAIATLKKHGEAEPLLYTLALKYLTSSSEVLAHEGAAAELTTVLARIRERRLLAPLQVVELLGASSAATVGAVKPYLLDVIEREKKEIDSNAKLVESYRSESEQRRREARELASGAVALQSTRCARCNGTLDLPVVHFLCRHSFHQRCVAEAPSSDARQALRCPLCQDMEDAARQAVRERAAASEKQDLFREGLLAAKDKPQFVFSRIGALV